MAARSIFLPPFAYEYAAPPVPYPSFAPVTHVTGIACGNGTLSGGRYRGIAPQAHIISLKILDAMGQGTSLRAIRAMRWILDNAPQYNIKVVNLSIGTNDRRVHRPLQEAVESLWHKGIVVVAAAANPDGGTHFLPPPSLSPSILSVGTWEDREWFPAKQTTSVGQPDLWAHGENIISVLSPNYNFSLQNRSKSSIVDHSYIAMSGASMATPMVSGMAACLLERFPSLTPSQVKQRLCAAAEKNGGLLEPSCLPE